MEYIDRLESLALVYGPYVLAGAAVAWAAFKVIAKYTKTKLDDEIVDAVEAARKKEKKK